MTGPARQDDPCPPPAVPLSDGLFGMAGLAAMLAIVVATRPPAILAVSAVVLATAMPMLARELRRCPARDDSKPGSPLSWLFGFAALSAVAALVHYQWSGSLVVAIAWMLVAPAFLFRLALEWKRAGLPRFSGAPAAVAQALAGRLREPLWPSLRLWGLKAFFVPLYALSLFALLRSLMTLDPGGAADVLTGAVLLAFTVDLSFGLSGYLFASNRLAATVKSTQPRLLGWAVCVACYEPVFAHWPAFRQVVLTEIAWPSLVAPTPLHVAAGIAMLMLLALYVSATVVFGLRFSNLTNRGVITSGPYRLMKHPAYFAHAANAWIISLAFLPLSPASILVPLAFTILYRLRAITEEQHMSEDPAYLAYSAWIARNGLAARARRVLAGAGQRGFEPA